MLVFLAAVGIYGQHNPTSIAVVLKDGMDTSKSIGQLKDEGYIGFRNVLATEYKETFANALTENDLLLNKDKNLKFPLQPGQTISKGFLTVESGGNLSASIPKKFSLYFIQQDPQKPSNNLPADAAAGDRVDVIYTYTKLTQGSQTPQYISAVLLENIEIFQKIEAKDGVMPGVYLKVSKQEQQMLVNASQGGTFTLRLPGTKEIELCKNDKEIAKRQVDRTFDCYTDTDGASNPINSDRLKALLEANLSSEELKSMIEQNQVKGNDTQANDDKSNDNTQDEKH